jgi:hypothetical protein
VTAFAVALVTLAGCGGATGGGTTGGGTTTTVPGGLTIDLPGGGQGGDAAQASPVGWPPAAPADIPPFPGTVENLMTGRQGGSSDAEHRFGVRIFYGGVTRDAYDAYLASLRTAGYALKGIVYYTDATAEGEANARRRADAGDYDAAIATKAPRVLTVTVPATAEGEITLDIDGLTQAENTALNVVAWPAAWAERLPAPDGCHLDDRGILAVSETSIQVSCRYDDPKADHQATVAAYTAKLATLGYAVAGSSDPSSVVLRSERVEVHIIAAMGGSMDIQANMRADTASAGGWPADWVERVPPPDRCTYGADTLVSYGPTLLGIGCVYADPAAGDAILAAYAQKLNAAGFTRYQPAEQYTPGTVSMQRGTITVHVSPGSYPGGMVVFATDGG